MQKKEHRSQYRNFKVVLELGIFFFSNRRNVESVLQPSHKHDKMCFETVTFKNTDQIQHRNLPGCRSGKHLWDFSLSKVKVKGKSKVLAQVL